MTKPGVFSLSGDAKDFVFGNGPLIKQSLKITLPLVLLIGVLNQVAKMHGQIWAIYALQVPLLYLFACYALTWHRNALVAVDETNVVNPFKTGVKEWKFVGLFVALTGGLSLYMSGIMYVTQIVLPPYGDHVALAGNIAALFLIFGGMYGMMRLSFLLPAQSVGVTLKFKEIIAASRGVVWPVIGTVFIYALLFLISMSAYLAILRVVIGIVGSGEVVGGEITAIIMALIASLPIQSAVLVLVALYTTALSKAYRWGMENNSL